MRCTGAILAGMRTAWIAALTAKHASTILFITPPSLEHNSCPTVLVPMNLLLILVWTNWQCAGTNRIFRNKVKTDKKLLKKSSKSWAEHQRLVTLIFNLSCNMVFKIFLLLILWYFVYQPAENRWVPTFQEHFIDAQDKASPLPIWRPEIMLDCQYHDLTDDEYLQMLDFFCSCLMGKKDVADSLLGRPDDVSEGLKDSYHLWT